ETTDRAFSLMVSNSWLAGLFRTQILAKILAAAMSRDRFQRFAFRTISQTGLQYRDSPLSEALAGLPDGAPRPGDRFPWLHLRFQPNGPIEDLYQRLDDRSFHLILFGQDIPPGGVTALGDQLRIHAVPRDPVNDRELARVGIPQPSCYLLRPDGYVGLAGA